MDLSNYIVTKKPNKRLTVRMNETELATITLFAKQRGFSVNAAFRLLVAAVGYELDIYGKR